MKRDEEFLSDFFFCCVEGAEPFCCVCSVISRVVESVNFSTLKMCVVVV